MSTLNDLKAKYQNELEHSEKLQTDYFSGKHSVLERVIADIDSLSLNEWVSVENSPLFTRDEKGRWECTEAGDGEFLAAVLELMIDGVPKWWIKHCVIQDHDGLCVIGEDENEKACYEIEDVDFYMPIPSPPQPK